ncbi:MAG: hypothetical protein M1444_01200 [Patescibacteria group bacterium]|nr:hypothetical protein [Patescibacteria group bacterium]
MNNINEEVGGIKIEQLLSESAFLDYCNSDFHGHRKLDITPEFLRALESDNFLFPLIKKKEVSKDSTENNEIEVNYFSPHQIYVVSSFAKNQIHDGQLWVKDNVDFYKQQGYRMVSWGWSGYAFNITLGQNSGKLQQGNISTLYKDLHNFLKMLHSFDQDKVYYGPKSRKYSAAPDLSFKYPELTLKELEKYVLNTAKLNFLRREIAYLATQIDPLEHWYYYINRHPLWRRDDFKGEALLAQELYVIAELIEEVLENVSGEKQPPIFELIYRVNKIYPYNIPQKEYVHGTDVKSMWSSLEKFKLWGKEKSNKELISDLTLERLENFKKELKEYEDKYGARSFISNGIREVETEEKIKIEDLDLKTKNYVEQILRQAEKELKEGNRQFLSLWDNEIEERIKNKEISLDEAKKEDYALFIKREIFEAIESRLSDLRRTLWDIFNTVYDEINKSASRTWDKVNSDNNFWFENKDKLINLTREEQNKLYMTEHNKVRKEAEHWSLRRDEFGRVMSEMEFIYCSVCRQKPVRVYQSSNDQQLSRSVICDDCIKNAKDPKTIKQAELKCDYCGYMLYKYAYKNRLNDLLFNKAPADIDVELEYGRLKIEIKCRNCKQVNVRQIDWGWVA